jgi:outer membrane protein assembly factor BamE (lipoprotein component of BamABCDE complex)
MAKRAHNGGLSRLYLLTIVTLGALSNSGCFAILVVGRHYGKEALAAPTLSDKGKSRSELINALGTPSATQIDNGKTTDVFLLPNNTWIVDAKDDFSSAGAGKASVPEPGMVYILVAAAAVALAADPVVTTIFLYKGRDATKCEYKVTYDKDERVENVEVRYPRGFDPNVCSGPVSGPR